MKCHDRVGWSEEDFSSDLMLLLLLSDHSFRAVLARSDIFRCYSVPYFAFGCLCPGMNAT